MLHSSECVKNVVVVVITSLHRLPKLNSERMLKINTSAFYRVYMRKFNNSLPRSRFCGEKHRVTRQKETILKQGVSRIHRNNFEYTNFIMI